MKNKQEVLIKDRATARFATMLDADEAAFSAAVKAIWPNAFFTPYDWIGTRKLPLLDSLAECREWYLKQKTDHYPYIGAWILLIPNGWRPRMEKSSGPRPIWQLRGGSPLAAVYRVGRMYRDRHSSVLGGGCSMLVGQDVFISWCSNNEHTKAQKAFIGKMKRLIAKLCTNRLQLFNHTTGKIVNPEERSYIWVGQHAMQWAAESPKHVIGDATYGVFIDGHLGMGRHPVGMKIA